MTTMRYAYLGLFAVLLAVPAFAETVPTPTPAPAADRVEQVLDRNVNQQQRIEDGLKAGSLTTGEAARLEKGEAKIDSMESHALKDGKMGAGEQAAINRAENKESAAINHLNTNARVGDPTTASSKRMQADVQRDIHQEKRIEGGVQNGSLTNREAGKLQKGEAKVDRAEYRAGRDGHVGKREQAHVRKVENKESAKIWHKKHNDRVRHAAGKPIRHGGKVQEPVLNTTH